MPSWQASRKVEKKTTTKYTNQSGNQKTRKGGQPIQNARLAGLAEKKEQAKLDARLVGEWRVGYLTADWVGYLGLELGTWLPKWVGYLERLSRVLGNTESGTYKCRVGYLGRARASAPPAMPIWQRQQQRQFGSAQPLSSSYVFLKFSYVFLSCSYVFLLFFLVILMFFLVVLMFFLCFS